MLDKFVQLRKDLACLTCKISHDFEKLNKFRSRSREKKVYYLNFEFQSYHYYNMIIFIFKIPFFFVGKIK